MHRHPFSARRDVGINTQCSTTPDVLPKPFTADSKKQVIAFAKFIPTLLDHFEFLLIKPKAAKELFENIQTQVNAEHHKQAFDKLIALVQAPAPDPVNNLVRDLWNEAINIAKASKTDPVISDTTYQQVAMAICSEHCRRDGALTPKSDVAKLYRVTNGLDEELCKLTIEFIQRFQKTDTLSASLVHAATKLSASVETLEFISSNKCKDRKKVLEEILFPKDTDQPLEAKILYLFLKHAEKTQRQLKKNGRLFEFMHGKSLDELVENFDTQFNRMIAKCEQTAKPQQGSELVKPEKNSSKASNNENAEPRHSGKPNTAAALPFFAGDVASAEVGAAEAAQPDAKSKKDTDDYNRLAGDLIAYVKKQYEALREKEQANPFSVTHFKLKSDLDEFCTTNETDNREQLTAILQHAVKKPSSWFKWRTRTGDIFVSLFGENVFEPYYLHAKKGHTAPAENAIKELAEQLPQQFNSLPAAKKIVSCTH